MKREINQIENTEYDILVIGAGIHGSTIAWLCSEAGLKTCIIDKSDFASGTSFNSQKIIHGGLRYLQDFDIKRIRQSVKERNRFLRLAPHLIKPLPCIMPIQEKGLKSKYPMAVGLKLYDIISCNRNRLIDDENRINGGRIISKKKTDELLPFMTKIVSDGSAVWYDAFCNNTERMIISFLKSAYRNGSTAINYLEAIKININKTNEIKNVEVLDNITGNLTEIRSKVVINASGKDCGDLFGLNYNKDTTEYVGGINLVVNKSFTKDFAIGMPSLEDDYRLYVTTPWKNKTIVGTEWFELGNSKFEVGINEISLLVNKFNRAFPGDDIKLSDISFIYKGIVPAFNGEILKHEKFFTQKTHGIRNLITVLGVKYTTAVNVASQVLNEISLILKKRITYDSFKPLVGGEIDDVSNSLKGLFGKWRDNYERNDILNLFNEYGSETENVLRLSDVYQKKGFGKKDALIHAKVHYALSEESAVKLSDVLLRRTDIGNSEIPNKKTINIISKQMQQRLEWSEEKRLKEVKEVNNFYPRFIEKHTLKE